MRFLGNTEAKTDAKGRVFLPVAFRKVLQASGEESLVLCKDLHQPCLVLYPESVWNEQMDALRNRLSRWNAAHQQLFRQFVSDVELVTLDGNDTIEIWSEANTQQPFVAAHDFGPAVEAIMALPEGENQ